VALMDGAAKLLIGACLSPALTDFAKDEYGV
jgi:hypothetical protein